MNYSFEWDPRKAKQNERKHGVTFQRAATVFADPDQISLFDEIHSEAEERWVTIGIDYNGNILVVVHTYSEVGIDEVRLRIISARKATTQESLAYEQPH